MGHLFFAVGDAKPSQCDACEGGRVICKSLGITHVNWYGSKKEPQFIITTIYLTLKSDIKHFRVWSDRKIISSWNFVAVETISFF